MFCGKCGAQNTDNAAFCTICGAQLKGAQSVSGVSPNPINQNEKNRKVGIIAVAAIAVVLVITAILIFSGRSYRAVVKQFFNASLEGDSRAILELIPEEMILYSLDQYGLDYDEWDGTINDMEYGDSILHDEDSEASYKILYVEDVTGRDLAYIKDFYESIDVRVSAAKIIEVQLTIKEYGETFTETWEIPVIKIGRSWYLYVGEEGIDLL